MGNYKKEIIDRLDKISGKPVIKDKALLSDAMEKLAGYEDTGLTWG